MRNSLTTFGLLSFVIATAEGQDRFPTPIPTSDLTLRIEEFATIPDSASRQPPRLSVLTPDPTGRLFVNDQRGPLYSIDGTGNSVTEYLDLRDYSELRMLSTSEAGFQSFAWHPDFANPGTAGFGRFYTIHSSRNTASAPDFDPGGGTDFHTLLLEWNTATPDAMAFEPADADQPYREILRFKQPFGNHNAGLIAFNPTAGPQDSDFGNLYVALGDGGSGGDPQENGEDPSNPYGAILRIDPLGSDGVNGQYGIVAENQLAGDNDPQTLGEIYAYGLRNPQRFGWDSANGNLFIADIGQSAVEEINLAINGGNFGWDLREGSFRFESNNTEGLLNPVAEYDHTNVVTDPPTNIPNRAVTVGEVARGTSVAGLDGLLLLSDFPTGLIFTLDVDNDPLDGGQDGLRELQPVGDNGQPVRLLELINQTRASRGLPATTRADLRFGFNTPGEVYILNKQDGIVRRLVSANPAVAGDFNDDGFLTVEDIDLLSGAIAGGTGDLRFDLTDDDQVNRSDLETWVVDLKNTWIGDANLDGEFNTSDLTQVLQAGQYEDLVEGNSTWATGDWNADLDFDTGDLVYALQSGGYELGPRQAVRAVAEPAASGLILMGISCILLFARRHRMP